MCMREKSFVSHENHHRTAAYSIFGAKRERDGEAERQKEGMKGFWGREMVKKRMKERKTQVIN